MKQRVLISCGPTREAIDPVRYITNLSTGSLGIEIAKRFVQKKYSVTLVHGPIPVPTNLKCTKIPFESVRELQAILKSEIPKHDALYMVAAVSDFRVQKMSQTKIKRNKKNLTLKLIKNPDILKSLSRLKKNRTYIGFCIESNDVILNAKTKLKHKNLDYIVAHEVGLRKKPFGNIPVKAHILSKQGKTKAFRNIRKKQLAGHLAKLIP